MPSWRFRPHHADEKIRNPIQGEFFSEEAVERPAQALVREVIQNSLDARAGDEPVVVRFAVSGPKGLSADAARFWLGGAWEHLRAEGSGLRSVPDRPTAARFLAIEDFGTTGLDGDPLELRPHGAPSRLFAFFRAEGISQKGGRDGGRWGVGKTVFLRSSELNTILSLTVRRGAPRELVFGQTVLRYHWLKSAYFTPDGAFGDETPEAIVPSANAALATRLRHDFALARTDEPGLSVVVPFAAEELTSAAVLEAVMREYFYPILSGRLVVHVSDVGGAEKTLNAETLVDELVRARLKDSVGPLAALSLWVVREGLDRAVSLLPPAAGAPAWSDEMLPRATRDALSAKYRRGEPLLVRVPLTVTPVDSGPKETSFYVALRRDVEDRGAAPAFVRNGIQIPKALERRVRGQSLWALVVIEDQPIATLLGDAETPAHTHWSKDTQNFKNKYRYGPSTIDFVRQAPRALAEMLTEAAKGRDFLSLVDFFPVPRGPAERGAPSARPAADAEEGARELAPDTQAAAQAQEVRVERVDGGFRVASGGGSGGSGSGSASGAAPSPVPGAFTVAVAYDCTRGNPLRRWDARDFDVAELPVRTDGARVVRRARNEIAVAPQARRFVLDVTGFDPNRDLFVRVTPLEAADESAG